MKIFYPGTLWKKRMGFIGCLFLAGPNCFLNDLQNILFDAGEEILLMAEDLSAPADDAASIIENNVLPLLETIESTPFGRRIIDNFDLADTKDLANGIAQVHAFRKILKEYAPYFSLSAKIVRWTSYLFWFSIISSCAWLTIDLFKSRSKTARLLVLGAFILAIPTNILVYEFLNDSFMQANQADITSLTQMLH